MPPSTPSNGPSEMRDAGEPVPQSPEEGPEPEEPAATPSEVEPEVPVEPEPATHEPSVPAQPEPQPEVPSVTFSKEALLGAVSACTLGKLRSFEQSALELRSAAQAHAASEGAEGLSEVQLAWVDAMLVWQRAELFQFGPAALPTQPGGNGLREHIYSWNRNPPGNNRCRIEQFIVNEGYAAADFRNSLVVVRSLSTIEFLTFQASNQTACTSFDDIVASGTWAALSEEQLRTRRAAYTSAVAADVASRASELLTAWEPRGGDFGATLSNPGSGNALFPDEQTALNAVASALFYLDKDVKDYKLGMPLGLIPDCPKASCPEAFESQYARASTLFLYENLNGFEELFSGCGPDPEALGFDDWLVAVGASDLATRMQAALDNAQQVVATLDPPLEDALLVDPSRVSAVHTAIKGVTDLLKTEFVTVLNLELPGSVATDND